MGIQYNQANDVSTTLNGAITSGATSITVTSGANFPAVPFVVRIDSEILLVTSTGTGTNWTVTRASETVNGSATAASHADGAEVRQVTTAAAWNALVQLQDATPGTQQTGHIHVSGSGLFGTTSYNATTLIANNNSAIGVTSSFTNNSSASAGVFSNNGANATLTATNSGAGIGITGSTADSGSPGTKGQNTGSGLGIEGYSSSGIAGYLHNGSDNIVLKLQETSTQTNDVLQFQNSSGTRQGGIKKSAVADFTKVQISGTDRLNSDGSASLVNVTMNGLIKYTVDTWANRPGSPATGDVHYATDRHIEYYWDGTRWLSKTLYYVQFDNNSTTIPLSASNTAAYVVDRPAWNYDMYLIDFAFRFRVSTTFDSTHKWTMTLDRVDSSNVQTAISSTIDTFQTGRTAGTFYYETPSTNANLTLNTVVTITNGWQFRTNWTLVSTAGVLTLGPFSLSYRLVG